MKNLFIVPICISIFISCKKEKGSEKDSEEYLIPVTVIRPTYGDIYLNVKFSSSIEGNPDILVYTSIPGYYYKRLKNEGEYVKKGEVILLLERKEFGLEFEPFKIEAPVSGKISYFKYDLGEYIPPQKPLARIYGDREFKVRLMLPYEYHKNIFKGKNVKIFVNSQEFQGTVGEISNTSDPLTGNFEITIFFKTDKKILPGTPCEVELTLFKKEKVLKIPSKCVLGAFKKTVFVIVDGVTKRVPIVTGIEGGGYIEIVEGITEKDLVVLDGAELLREGIKVKIIKGG
ncbi:MAG: HlyD family efflux transporter periplasmic adaptor subunit [Candidatus Hydrothermales bacterium]